MLNNLKDNFIGKFIDFLLNSHLGKAISGSLILFTGSFLSSNEFVKLIINKQYFEFFIVLVISIFVFLITTTSLYLIINSITKYYKQKEAKLIEQKKIKDKELIENCKYNETKLIKYKLNFNIIKEEIKMKVDLKEYFEISHLNLFYYQMKYKLDLKSIYISEDSFLEITFNPILNEEKILTTTIYNQLNEIFYPSNKKILNDNHDYKGKFNDQVHQCFDYYMNRDIGFIGEDESPENYPTLLVREKLKDNMLSKIYSNNFKNTKINNFNLNFDLENFSLESEFIIKYYFKNNIVESRIITLKNILSQHDTSIEFDRIIYLRDFL